MKYLSIASILVFYIFFFTRAFLLGKRIGKSIKARDRTLNISIISAGLSSVLFILQKSYAPVEKFFFILPGAPSFEIAGTLLILIGLITSSAASLGLGDSWRVGVNGDEETSLVVKGIYGISRNPYFLSYDLVLFGLVFSSLSVIIILTSLMTMFLFHLLILKEETYLEEKHGDKYRIYKKQVRRYL
jgi:protein-S-isoprenylcysteine O-methyltransferase Ste14